MHSVSMFIFRRDLRLADNTALIEALKQSTHVIACFIFDPKQVGTSNKYKSDNAIQFMLNSIEDLSTQLEKIGGKLYLFYGDPIDVIKNIIKDVPLQAIFVNRDYTPFSMTRDAAIQAACKELDISFNAFDDALLNPPSSTLKKDGKPYTIFTPYFKNAYNLSADTPSINRHTNYYKKPLSSLQEHAILENKNARLFIHGGRQEAKNILSSLATYENYEKERDIPSLNKTTTLSAHLKFGTCSVREAYHAIANTLGQHHPLIRQLYWRDFFTHIANNFPHVFGNSFNPRYQNICWLNNMKMFQAWCDGKTGFPIVDAGMRQLNTTGWMHNRVRMIVASFLVKDLHINWQLGEQYFATKLIDYDPAVNNGNWQWAASTGCDAQPYFRIFNPWLQQKRFDPLCEYIKQWVPEIKNLSPKDIHQWEKTTARPAQPYPKPIIQHALESKIAVALFKNGK